MNRKRYGLKFDYSALKKRIRGQMKIKELARLCGMHENLLYRKLLNMSSLTHEDMVVISANLGIRPEEIGEMFCQVKEWGNAPQQIRDLATAEEGKGTQ